MIRKIDETELSLTKEVASAFFVESGIAGTLDFEYFCYRWQYFIKKDLGNIFILEVNGIVRGLIGGFFVECSMTGDREAIEAFWYVQKELRGSGEGLGLIRALEDEAKKRGCKRIKMAYLMSINPVKMEALYHKLGYEPLQKDFVKELP